MTFGLRKTYALLAKLARRGFSASTLEGSSNNESARIRCELGRVMKPVRETIKETLQLASAGELERALVLLDRAVRDAITEGESVATLARHAGVLAERAGDLGAVRHYYEVAVERDPDPWTYLALGDVCSKLGDDVAARTAYASGRMMAEDGRDPDVLALLKQRVEA
jgi:Flp pilus assembly protein TadD